MCFCSHFLLSPLFIARAAMFETGRMCASGVKRDLLVVNTAIYVHRKKGGTNKVVAKKKDIKILCPTFRLLHFASLFEKGDDDGVLTFKGCLLHYFLPSLLGRP